MNTEKDKIEIQLLLDLMLANSGNVLLSEIDFPKKSGNLLNRKELFLQNVGRICIYRYFDESHDVQIPVHIVFYGLNTNHKTYKKISDSRLMWHAIMTAYKIEQTNKNIKMLSLTDDIPVKRILQNQYLFDKKVKNLYDARQDFLAHKYQNKVK